MAIKSRSAKGTNKRYIENIPPPLVLHPTTTAEENIVTAGQRRINLIWEITQAIISLSITAFFLYSKVKEIKSSELDMAFSFVIGLYLQRVNHVKIGGVGYKAPGATRGGSE